MIYQNKFNIRYDLNPTSIAADIIKYNPIDNSMVVYLVALFNQT